jgi:hypothetical protein
MLDVRKFNRFILNCLVLSGLSVSGANAASLNVVDGLLVGASDVFVGGSGFYDVNFVDGTCIGLFDGCNADDDFDFGSSVDANMAARALVDQVFIDGPDGMFDTNPGLTFGCGNLDRCVVVIPHTVLEAPLFMSAITMNNVGTGNAGWTIFSNILDSSIYDLKVFAQFELISPVPVPAAFWLFGTALIGLFGFKKRKVLTA